MKNKILFILAVFSLSISGCSVLNQNMQSEQTNLSTINPNLSAQQISKIAACITAQNTNRLEYKNADITLQSESIAQSTSPFNNSNLDFYHLRYVAHILPVMVTTSSPNITYTTQSNSIFMSTNKAYIGYNYQGDICAGGLQIIDITDLEKPVVKQEIAFAGLEINAVYIDETSQSILIGGQADYDQFGFSAFVIKAPLGDLNSENLAAGLVTLNSYAVTSITQKDNNYYVSVGAKNGGIHILSENLTKIDFITAPDTRDLAAYNQGLIGLYGSADNSAANGGLLLNPENGTTQYSFNNRINDYHKANLELFSSANCQLYQDEDALVFTGVSEGGFKILKVKNNTSQLIYELDNPEGNNEYLTNSATFDNGLIFLATGAYGFRVLSVNGYDPLNTQPFAEVVGYHTLQGGLYDNRCYSANHIKYRDQRLFVASGKDGVNVYALMQKNTLYTTPVPANLISSINVSFHDCPILPSHPCVQPSANPYIIFKQNVQLECIFLDEEAALKNTVGYFSFDNNHNLTTELKTIFANASRINSGGLMKPGDTVLLSGEFGPNKNLGFWIKSNGYSDANGAVYTSFDQQNPNSIRQIAMSYDEASNTIIVCFEDLTQPQYRDFNDVVCLIKIRPIADPNFDHLKLSDIVELQDIPAI